jgi:peptide/nickel transport system permease protein
MFASVARMTRSAMLEVIRQDYIRTARAKGLRGRTVLFRHALRNAMLPVFTILGLQMAYLLSGTVIVEAVFGLPGIGKLMLDAVVWRDYPLLQGLVLFTGLLLVLTNLAVDIGYAFFDPRIRESYQAA